MIEKTLTKGSLLSVGAFLVSIGSAMLDNPNRTWPAIIVIALGVICIFGREIAKNYLHKQK